MHETNDHRSVAERLATIRDRIRVACERVERAEDEVTLVAVSKRQPESRIRTAVEAGARVLGENQVQEAQAKIAALQADLDWQLIGHLQSNKAKLAVGLFSTIHSLDRPKIVARVEREAARQNRRIDGFLEVNLGAEPSKHGFSPRDFVETAAETIADLEYVRIIGLMAIPPQADDPEAARPWFRQLCALRDELAAHRVGRKRASFGALSMGMSNDFEIAIEEGATHVRVGTSLFGPRPS